MTLNDLPEGQLAELTKVVRKVARSVAFNWPSTITADDLEQALCLHILERPSTLQTIAEADPGHRYRLLVRLAHREAGRQRDSYDYFTGNYRYAVDEVKKLLAGGVLDDDVIPGHDGAALDLEAGMLILLADKPQYAEAIVSRYTGAWESPQDKSGQNALSRGLTALTDEMNRSFTGRDYDHEGPGNRTVISNAAARSITGGV